MNVNPAFRAALATIAPPYNTVHQTAFRSIEAQRNEEHRAITFDEMSWEMATEDEMTPENIGSWMTVASDERESCVYFGPISTPELFKILYGKKSNGEQREAAARTLRLRFQAEFCADIAQRVSDMDDTPDTYGAQQDAKLEAFYSKAAV